MGPEEVMTINPLGNKGVITADDLQVSLDEWFEKKIREHLPLGVIMQLSVVTTSPGCGKALVYVEELSGWRRKVAVGLLQWLELLKKDYKRQYGR